MLCTGIPELTSAEDIEYIRYAFAVGENDEVAANEFTKLIYSSLKTRTTVINDAIHVFVHS
jgi:phosphatidylinositol-4,5-bisphosphate 3-kinase catalytic subunit alpha/beta/delta